MATTRGAPYLFIHLFIFPSCHHAKSNTDFMFQFTCFHPVFCVSSVHLSSLHRIILCSPKLCPPCNLKSICLTLICILFIHTCFSFHLFPITFLDQMLLSKATIDPGAYFADWTDWSFGLHAYLNRLQVADEPERKLRMQTRARAGLKAR